jgi:hypothetical protein
MPADFPVFTPAAGIRAACANPPALSEPEE